MGKKVVWSLERKYTFTAFMGKSFVLCSEGLHKVFNEELTLQRISDDNCKLFAVVWMFVPLPHIHILKSQSLKWWYQEVGFREVLRSWGWVSGLIKKAQSSLPLATLWGHSKNICRPEEVTCLHWHPDLRCLASRTVRNTTRLFISRQSVVFCYSSMNTLKCSSTKNSLMQDYTTWIYPKVSLHLENGEHHKLSVYNWQP